MAVVKFSESTRTKIKFRSSNRCELCGSRLVNGQIHHRQPRGMGGSPHDEAKGGAANGLHVHFKCHELIEQNRAKALEYGWLVPQHGDSSLTPVRLWDGWWLLADDGSMSQVKGL